MTSPMKPSIEIQSPSLTVVSSTEKARALMSMSSSPQPDDADLAHLPGDERRVAGHTALGSEDALRGVHAADVLGLVKSRTSRTCSPRSAQATASAAEKTTRPVAAPGPAGRPQASALTFSAALLVLGAKDRPQKLVQLVGLDAHERLFGPIRPWVGHVDGDADGREAGALAVARLQHEQPAALDRELEVLHVAHLALEGLAHVHELVVDLGPDLL